MTQRTRKLVGTIVLAVFVMIYAFFAVALLSAAPPVTSVWASVAVYIVAGLLWVVPAGAVVSWMQRSPKPRRPATPP